MSLMSGRSGKSHVPEQPGQENAFIRTDAKRTGCYFLNREQQRREQLEQAEQQHRIDQECREQRQREQQEQYEQQNREWVEFQEWFDQRRGGNSEGTSC